MNKITILTILIFLLSSCTEDDSQPHDINRIGKSEVCSTVDPLTNLLVKLNADLFFLEKNLKTLDLLEAEFNKQDLITKSIIHLEGVKETITEIQETDFNLKQMGNCD